MDKVFSLDSTNINEWDSSLTWKEKDLAAGLNEAFKSGCSKEDILYEIMLKYSVFDENIEEIAKLSPKTVMLNEAEFKDDNEKINDINNLKKFGVEDIKCI